MAEKTQSMKDLWFTVKKVANSNSYFNDNYREIIGIILPYFQETYYETSEISEKYFWILPLSGDNKVQLSLSMSKISSTRIMDSKLRNKIDKFIQNEKEKFIIQKNMIQIRDEYMNKLNQLKKKIEKNIKIHNELKKAYEASTGFISKKDILEHLHNSVTISESRKNIQYETSRIEVVLSPDAKRIETVKVFHEICIRKYVRENEYDFLYEEYDGTLCTISGANKSRDFESLKKHYFNEVGKLKLGFKVLENFNAYTGDKRSLFIEQIVGIKYKLPATKESLKRITSELKTVTSFM